MQAAELKASCSPLHPPFCSNDQEEIISDRLQASQIPPRSFREIFGAWWRDTACVPCSSPSQETPGGAVCSDSGRPQVPMAEAGPGHPGRGLGVEACLRRRPYDSALARRTLCSPNPPGNREPGGTVWLNSSVSQTSQLSSLMPARAERQCRCFPGASGLGLGLAFGFLRAYLFYFFPVVCISNPDQSHQSLRWYSIS